MTILRALTALAALVLAACMSSAPTAADMQRFYEAAEQQAQRDIDRLAERRNHGEISPEEYQRREEAIKESIPQRANTMAWTRHELTESEMRGLGIPTATAPVTVGAPGRGAGNDSFYRPAGQVGAGYQGLGSGGSRGSQQGTVAGTPVLQN